VRVDPVRFVRIGTLDAPDRLPPDVHIFTASKQPWPVISPETPSFEAYYNSTLLWSEESLERRRVLFSGR